jgi:AmiR/NasT family two-component response regulator
MKTPSETAARGKSASPLRILITEDDALINEGIANQLTRLGYAVVGRAYDGPRAVQLAAQTGPDLVLMDLQMIDPITGREDPRAGLKAAEALQAQRPVGVVLLTAHESPDLIAQANRAGVSAYLVKPARDNDLDRTIAIARARFQDLLELRRLASELQRRNQELQAALAKVKTLNGLLPICAACKKIRDDRGYWRQVEQYVSEHSEATFTHGICPSCCQKLYPELYDQMRANGMERTPQTDPEHRTPSDGP